MWSPPVSVKCPRLYFQPRFPLQVPLALLLFPGDPDKSNETIPPSPPAFLSTSPPELMTLPSSQQQVTSKTAALASFQGRAEGGTLPWRYLADTTLIKSQKLTPPLVKQTHIVYRLRGHSDNDPSVIFQRCMTWTVTRRHWTEPN